MPEAAQLAPLVWGCMRRDSYAAPKGVSLGKRLQVLAQEDSKQHPVGSAELALVECFDLNKHKEKLNFPYQEKD